MLFAMHTKMKQYGKYWQIQTRASLLFWSFFSKTKCIVNIFGIGRISTKVYIVQYVCRKVSGHFGTLPEFFPLIMQKDVFFDIFDDSMKRTHFIQIQRGRGYVVVFLYPPLNRMGFCHPPFYCIVG